MRGVTQGVVLGEFVVMVGDRCFVGHQAEVGRLSCRFHGVSDRQR